MNIPTRAPDVEAFLVAGLSAVADTRNTKPERANPYRMLILRADLQQKVTPISRYCRVGIQAWSVSPDGTADLGDAFDLASDAASWIENNITGPILSADIESGPSRVVDDVTRIEFQYVTALLEVAV